MHRQFRALEQTLREFIEQPDYPALVLAAADPDVVMPAKILESIDRQSDAVVVLSFPFDCTSAGGYLDQVVQQLALQAEAANADARAEERRPWPEQPLSARDPRAPPAERLRCLVEWAASIVEGDAPIVWALLPSTISDHAGWQQLGAAVLPVRGVEPWMERHRFVVRDLHDSPLLIPELRSLAIRDVLVMELDFSPEQALDALVRQTKDTSRPVSERMDALFQLSAVDVAHARLPDAVDKYAVLFGYYDEQGDAPRKALCLAGAGDAHLRGNDPGTALVRYRQALALAGPTENLALMLPPLVGAGTAAMQLGDWKEAEGYWLMANQVAGKLFNPWAKCDALEQIGEARWQQGNYAGAVEAWTSGKQLAAQYGHLERRRSILDRMIVAYSAAHLWADVEQLRRERAEVPEG